MRLSIEETITIRCEPALAFDHTNAPENFTSFVGYGPIPGIRVARYRDDLGPRLAAVRDVENTDGSAHVEEVTVFDRPRRHDARIHRFGAPFSPLAREAGDDWRFSEERGATRIDRTFRVELTSALVLPAALVLKGFLRRAVRRDLANIKKALEAGDHPR
jgi:hypothetical protein